MSTLLETLAHQDWTLAWWDWWFALTWWQGLLVALAITPIGVWVVRLVFQGFWVNPLTHDWVSFNFDAALAVGIGAMLWLARDVPAGSGVTGTNAAWFNYGVVVFWLGFAMYKWWDERKEVPTWSRRLGATSLYHVGVIVYIGGLYVVLFWNTLSAPWAESAPHLVAHVMSILAPVSWLFAGMVVDPNVRTAPDGRSKFEYTSPRDGWRTVRRLLNGRRERNRRIHEAIMRLQPGLVVPSFRPLSNKLGALRPWHWLLDMHPFKLTLTLMAFSPGMLWVIDILLVHGRFVPLDQQWLSAVFDLALATAAGVMAWALRKADGEHFPPFLRRWQFHWGVLAVACAVGAYHVHQEWATVHIGPNWVYHNLVLYPLLGYLLGLLTITICVAMFRQHLLRERLMTGQVIGLMLIGLWLWAGNYDGSHQYAPGGVPKAEIANPPHGAWCGGLITRLICESPKR